jgi:hypothetical protein
MNVHSKDYLRQWRLRVIYLSCFCLRFVLYSILRYSGIVYDVIPLCLAVLPLLLLSCQQIIVKKRWFIINWNVDGFIQTQFFPM